MELNRKPTLQEERLLEVLVKKSSIVIREDWKEGLMVCPMVDGEMGSLSLFREGKSAEIKMPIEQVSDFQFVDLDGIEVIASLSMLNVFAAI